MEIPSESIKQLLEDFFAEIPDSGIESEVDVDERSVIVDSFYTPVTEAEVFEVLRTNPLLVPPQTDHSPGELFDCDDYALQFKASITALYRQKKLVGNIELHPPAVGIVISQKHALNIGVFEAESDEPRIFIIDPSAPVPVMLKDPQSSIEALKMPPIKLIYI